MNPSNTITSLSIAAALTLSTHAAQAFDMDVGGVTVPFDRIEEPAIQPLLVEYMGLLDSDNRCPEAPATLHKQCQQTRISLLNVLNTPLSTENEVAVKD